MNASPETLFEVDSEELANPGVFEAEFRVLPICDITVGDRLRDLDEDHVQTLVESFSRLGGRLQLQPIVVSHELVLSIGRHRLEAAKRSGWTHIGAMVAAPGLSPAALRFIEFEENRARSTPSPLELLQGWEEYAQPIIRAEAQLAMSRGGSNSHRTDSTQGARISCTLEPSKGPTFQEEPEQFNDSTASVPMAASVTEVSMRAAAKEYTGYSPETLDKVRLVRDLVEDETTPEPVRKAALRSAKDLSEPGAKIEPAYRRVVEAQTQVELDKEDPRVLEQLRLRGVLDKMLKDTSLMSDALQSEHGSDLRRAVLQGDAVAVEDLKAIRLSLTMSLAQVAAIAYEADHVGSAPGADSFFEIGVKVQELATEAHASFGGAQ